MSLDRRGLLAAIFRVGSRLRDLGVVLMVCRFSVLTLAVGIVFLVFVPQGQDVLRRLAGGSALQWAAFFLAVLLWALGSWYWARALLAFQFRDWPPAPDSSDPGRLAWIRSGHKWVPRVVGVLSILSVTVALLAASVPLYLAPAEFVNAKLEQQRLWWAAAISFGSGAGFVLFVHYRRRWFARFFAEPDRGAPPVGAYRVVAELPRATRLVLLASIAFAAVCLLGFSIRPLNLVLAPLLGAASILLLAAAAWAPVGSALTFVGNKERFPVLIALGALVVAFSLLNDNHPVRVLPNTASSPPLAGSVREHATRWLDERRRPDAPASPRAADARTPLFIVAAEGGGIRAAYWTSVVLAGIQDRHPAFASQLFAISGVSGGSLGGTVFAALTAEQQASGAPCPAAPGPDARRFVGCVREILSQDFLAPTFATMLYPDLVQRFLPFSIEYFDRGRTLEESWEHAWRRAVRNGRFAAPFGALWEGRSAPRVPALVLNGASVEEGRRLLTSNLPVSGSEFPDAADLRAELNGALRLSTAVNNSARFTYISPAGRFKRGRHVVDGGYFENSGALTAGEILAAVMAADSAAIVPVVIQITNDPDRDAGLTSTGNDVASEILAPILALLNARLARGSQAAKALELRVKASGGHFLQFGLRDRGVPLPLGWALSDSARAQIEFQLETYFECRAEDGKNAAVLRALLGPPVIPCVERSG
jgi:hypothetical protein